MCQSFTVSVLSLIDSLTKHIPSVVCSTVDLSLKTRTLIHRILLLLSYFNSLYRIINSRVNVPSGLNSVGMVGHDVSSESEVRKEDLGPAP